MLFSDSVLHRFVATYLQCLRKMSFNHTKINKRYDTPQLLSRVRNINSSLLSDFSQRYDLWYISGFTSYKYVENLKKIVPSIFWQNRILNLCSLWDVVTLNNNKKIGDTYETLPNAKLHFKRSMGLSDIRKGCNHARTPTPIHTQAQTSARIGKRKCISLTFPMFAGETSYAIVWNLESANYVEDLKKIVWSVLVKIDF